MFIQGSLQLAMVTKPSTRWKPSVIDWSKLEMKLSNQLESQNPNLLHYIISVHSPQSNSLDKSPVTINLHFIVLIENLCYILNSQTPIWKATFRTLPAGIFSLRRNFENPRMQFPNGATTKIGGGEEGEPDKKMEFQIVFISSVLH